MILDTAYTVTLDDGLVVILPSPPWSSLFTIDRSGPPSWTNIVKVACSVLLPSILVLLYWLTFAPASSSSPFYLLPAMIRNVVGVGITLGCAFLFTFGCIGIGVELYRLHSTRKDVNKIR